MTDGGPLKGCRVLELGSIIAGPFCGRLLADFGAEVIKIEPLDGDGLRSTGKRYKGKSLYAASLLRNKSLISVDLRTARGQDLVRRMVPKCDVLIENFTPGTLEKWGLGYEDLSRINPGLVMVRISGFGQTGPFSSRPGFGVVAEAMSGLRHITGDPDRPPARVSVAATDYLTGLYGAFGAMMALYHRTSSGMGQYVDAALYECAFSFMEPFVPAYEKLGFIASRTGSALADSAPNNLYPAIDNYFSFLQVPNRPPKPRSTGITIVEDVTIGTRAAKDVVEHSGELIDYMKIADHSALIARHSKAWLKGKVDYYHVNNIKTKPGGVILVAGEYSLKRNFQVIPGAEWLELPCKHIPDRYEHLMRYAGWYSNRARGECAKKSCLPAAVALAPSDEQMATEFAARARAAWARLIRKVYEADPLQCPKCKSPELSNL